VKYPPEERVRSLSADMEEARSWVLSGSIVSWGDALIPLFSLAVFVTLPKEVRMRRLAAREQARYGSTNRGRGRQTCGQRGVPELGSPVRQCGAGVAQQVDARSVGKTASLSGPESGFGRTA
jgi:hypothetical protein